MKTVAALAAGLTIIVGAPAFSQTPEAPPPPPRVLEDGDTEVAELVVIARRPAPDPSQAKTACLWAALPDSRRAALSEVAEGAVRTLARHDDLPLKNSTLTDAEVLAALVACRGAREPEARPFARTALLAFAAENATARVLAGSRIYEARLDQAWEALTRDQQEALLLASIAVNEDDDAAPDDFLPALFKLLRIVRPAGVWNPLAYRNGTVTHRVVYYYEGRSLRSVMERRF